MLAEIFLLTLLVRRQVTTAPGPSAPARDPRFVPYQPPR